METSIFVCYSRDMELFKERRAMVKTRGHRELCSNAQDGRGKGKMSGQKRKLLRQLQSKSYAH